MSAFLITLLSLGLLYLLSFPAAVIVAAMLVRKKLREYEDSGPFGY